MKTLLALFFLAIGSSAHAMVWKVDAVMSAYGVNEEIPHQKTKFVVHGFFDTEDGEPKSWEIDITFPRGATYDLYSDQCNPVYGGVVCDGRAVQGGFQFTYSYLSPGGTHSIKLIGIGVLTSAQFYQGGISGFEGTLEHGTMIPLGVPEPSIILFALAAPCLIFAGRSRVRGREREKEGIRGLCSWLLGRASRIARRVAPLPSGRTRAIKASILALTCIALAFGLENAVADVHVSAQMDHLVISVVDLTPNDAKAAGYKSYPIDLESQLGVAGVPGSDRIATFHDRDAVMALAPRYAMEDVLSIDAAHAHVTNGGQSDLLRAGADNATAGALANGQVTGRYLFDLLPKTQLTLTVHASLIGDSLSGDRVHGDKGFALAQLSSVTTPAVPEAAQAIYLGRIWPAGKQSDSWSGTLSFTISNPSNVIRESVEVDAFLMFEAAPAVPEPSSAVSALTGAVCMALAMRRRLRIRGSGALVAGGSNVQPT
jgi:hypothetical protein